MISSGAANSRPNDVYWWLQMTELITQQRVRRRPHRMKRAQDVPSGEVVLENSPEITEKQKAKSLGFTRGRLLAILGGVVVLTALFLVLSSSAIDRNLRGIGGGLGDLPRDSALDSLLESYLSPGRSPGTGQGNIISSGKVLMSYEPQTYIVERGDTVSEIALKFDLSDSTIISVNGIRDVRRLLSGVELKIPPLDGVMHVVKGNESLASIAQYYEVNLAPVLDINDIGTEIIHEGDKIFVPDASMPYVAYHEAMGDLFVWPLRGVLSSGFAFRTDPFTGLRSMHRGFDIVGKHGTAIRSANAGRVVDIGENNLYGKYVLVSHYGGYQTLYAHMSRWSVSEGQTVERRQKIGEVGNTGRSTGPHLHFSIFQNGNALNPGNFLNYY
jgi:murein DD-endopeptidase MepM/ murein hydrolase activator NlpD